MKKSIINFVFNLIITKKSIFFVILVLNIFPQKIQAQYLAEDNWHFGKVLLDTGDSLSGNLKFNLKEELLMLNAPQGLQTLSSRKVAMFSFYDTKLKRDRQFYSFMYPKTNNYKTPCFFEVLHHGEKISLVGREVLVQTTINNRPYYGGMYGSGYYGNPMNIPQTITSVKMEMYFLYNSGKMKSFNGNKNELYTIFADAQSQIKTYIKDRKPNLEKPDDIKQMLVFYHNAKK